LDDLLSWEAPFRWPSFRTVSIGDWSDIAIPLHFSEIDVSRHDPPDLSCEKADAWPKVQSPNPLEPSKRT
jgi:hypothetical protein